MFIKIFIKMFIKMFIKIFIKSTTCLNIRTDNRPYNRRCY